MLYNEYEQLRIKYYEAQNKCDEILSEKEALFQLTQPKAITLDKEKVCGGGGNNIFDTYLIKKEEKKIDQRLEEANNILKNRKQLLEIKEQELRKSKNWTDVIFVYYFIEKMPVKHIEKRIPYSARQIFRIIKQIRCHEMSLK